MRPAVAGGILLLCATAVQAEDSGTGGFESRWSFGLSFSQAIPVGTFRDAVESARGLTGTACYHAAARTRLEGSFSLYRGFSARTADGVAKGTALMDRAAFGAPLVGGAVRMAAVGAGVTHRFLSGPVALGGWAAGALYLLRPR